MSDKQIADLLHQPDNQQPAYQQLIRQHRLTHNIIPAYYRVDTCAAEFEAFTPYLYSTYERGDEAAPTNNRKVVILGGGPNRIGQGIEFDYCCVQACYALKQLGYRNDHGQLQSRNGEHRLRHRRSPVLRAADAGRCVERDRRRKTGGCDRAVRRADADQFDARPARSRRADLGHVAGLDRHRRRSRALRRPAARVGHSASRVGHGAFVGCGPARGAAHRLSGAGAPVVCAGRPRDGDRLR